MTIKEALLAQTPFEVSNNLVDVQLLNAGLEGATEYNSSLQEKVELVLAEIIRIKLAEPEVSEGSLSIKFDKPQMAQLRQDILDKYNIESGGISGASQW